MSDDEIDTNIDNYSVDDIMEMFNLPNNPGSFNNPFTPPNNYENWS